MTFELPELLDPIESLWVAFRATRETAACPYLNGKGTCVTGCRTEPSCITDCPDGEGWGPEIGRIEALIAHDLERVGPSAGPCRLRRRKMQGMHRYTSFHRDAPQGLSFCHGCRRVVIRGKGAWWR